MYSSPPEVYEKMTDLEALTDLLSHSKRRARSARGRNKVRLQRYSNALENFISKWQYHVPPDPAVRKRDNDIPFSSEELAMIEDRAHEQGDELVQQMAGVMLDLMRYVDLHESRQETLLLKARSLVGLLEYAGLQGYVLKYFTNFKEFVEGLSGKDIEIQLQKIEWEHGTPLTIQFKGHWAAQLISAAVAKMLKKDDGTYWNNVTYEMNYINETFYVEVQRKSGKTVKQQLNEAEAKIKELQTQLGAKHE
jgi:hypothetical protein